VGIVLFGLPANVLLLLHRRAAIPFAWLDVAFTTASLGVAAWQASLRAGPGMEELELAGFVIGAGGSLLVRLALLILYLVAIGKAREFFAAQDPSVPAAIQPG
jgi:hypothetical protein